MPDEEVAFCSNCGRECRMYRKDGDDGWVAWCRAPEGCGRAYGKGRVARDLLMQFARSEGIEPLFDKLGDSN